MSDFAEELSNALGAFKMELDARPNRLTRERRSHGTITRESLFSSQLPEPDRPNDAPQPPQLPCDNYGSGPLTVTFSGVTQNDDPTPSAINGTWVLSFVGTNINEEGQQICTWNGGDGADVTISAFEIHGNPLGLQWQLGAAGPNSSFTGFGTFNAPMGNDGPNDGIGIVSYA